MGNFLPILSDNGPDNNAPNAAPKVAKATIYSFSIVDGTMLLKFMYSNAPPIIPKIK